jgi:hypothetical protein
MTVPFWEDDPSAWDSLSIADIGFLGLVEVDVKIGRKLDTRSAPGADGATVRDKGYEPAKVKLTLTCWDREGYTSLVAILDELNPRTNPNRRRPVAIVHPALALLGIVSVYVESIGGLKPKGSGEGWYGMDIECVEYAPPAPTRRNVTRTPTPAPDAGAQTAFADPDAPRRDHGPLWVDFRPIPPPSQTATGPRR